MPRYQNLANGGISEPEFGNQTDKVTSGPMNNRIGVLLSWNDGPASHITSRVGISSMSIDRARSYVKKEIPSWKLNDTVNDAVDEWNQDVFNKIQIPIDGSANMTHVRLLYSSLYFMHLMPSDRTGENPLWDSDEPYWDDFYTMCEFLAILLCYVMPCGTCILFHPSDRDILRGYFPLYCQLLSYFPTKVLRIYDS